MNRLLINTANDELMIVLQTKDNLFCHKSKSKMHHNEIMLPEIDKILKENKLDISQIDEFGVVVGPGSFTGIRVGISTIKAFRDATNKIAKGVNNLEYLFALAKSQNSIIDTVAICGSRDSYFVAKEILGSIYIYDRNLTLNELQSLSKNPIGMFEQDDKLNCFVVGNDPKVFVKCFETSLDYQLVPEYYQLSQAENEKIARANKQIVEADESHIEKIAEIEHECIKNNTLSLMEITHMRRDNNYQIFVAKIDDEIAGFEILNKTDEINIVSIAVRKKFRNLGIATSLINKAQEYAKDNNIDTISLEVSESNKRAFVLYNKLGFEIRRERKNYYEDGSNCFEMTKKTC